ncbi:GPW/gp25 family protein [Neorhizobium sp. T786]|nr:GPW/gp25 family protein [Neorhizobium xiangyangii]
MNAATGKPLDGIDHLRQSIVDILSTRKGTRVMRRDYGSDVPNLVDRPVNDELPVDIYVAVAEALAAWEPRLVLREASMTAMGDGAIEFALTGDYLPDGQTLTLTGIYVR